MTANRDWLPWLLLGIVLGLVLGAWLFSQRTPPDAPRDPGDCAGEMPDDGKIIDAKDLQEAG